MTAMFYLEPQDINKLDFRDQIIIDNSYWLIKTIPMNALVPSIGMSDLFLSVIKMFNLYVEVDPENERNLLIETRDDFYAAGATQDWTYKLARDKNISLEPTSVLVDKRYVYTYQSDDDFDNSRYEGKYGRVYGDVRIDN